MYILRLNSIRGQNNEAFCVWSEMLSFLFSFLRNLKLHKICLTPHIMWFRMEHVSPIYIFSLVFMLVKSFSALLSEQLSALGRASDQSNELFRHLFVIWCFREHNRGPRRVISIELTFGSNWIFIPASLEIRFLGWKLFLVSCPGGPNVKALSKAKSCSN